MTVPSAKSASGRDADGPYLQLLQHLRETATLRSVSTLLEWDQETMMPPLAGHLRAEQLAMMSALVHRRRTDTRIADWLSASEADGSLNGDERIAANLSEIRRLYERATRLPESLVREMAETFSLSLNAWKDARERSDFASFSRWLEKVVRLNRAKAECLRTDEAVDRYDVLLEDFEPGARAAEIEQMFAGLRERLVQLLDALQGAPKTPDPAPNRLTIPIERQRALNRRVAEQLGYELRAGRLDTSAHPFCQDIGPGDTRITTRYVDDRFLDALSSTLHETGHALYEQGLPKQEAWGQPLATAASFALHESQSRMWENQVGRSRAFWEWGHLVVQEEFGVYSRGLTAASLFGACNLVEPSLIRVDADEATYNLHIMLRFDLERALLSGDLAVQDLPGAWNERMRADLGIEVPDDRRGCLQDVHWGMGAIGYFSTYTLGTLYAAQLWETVTSELPGLDDHIRRGDFAPLLEWLRSNVHAHGMRFRAHELCERVSGQPLDHEPLIRYLEAKLKPLYGL